MEPKWNLIAFTPIGKLLPHEGAEQSTLEAPSVEGSDGRFPITTRTTRKILRPT